MPEGTDEVSETIVRKVYEVPPPAPTTLPPASPHVPTSSATPLHMCVHFRRPALFWAGVAAARTRARALRARGEAGPRARAARPPSSSHGRPGLGYVDRGRRPAGGMDDPTARGQMQLDEIAKPWSNYLSPGATAAVAAISCRSPTQNPCLFTLGY